MPDNDLLEYQLSHVDNRILTTIVVGAGISGVRVALDLAETGNKVCLIDRSSAGGGILLKIDRQFPNDYCGMCRMLPMIDRDRCLQFCLRKGLFHENIEFFPSTEIVSIKGSPGRLTVLLSKKGNEIDHMLCRSCNECENVCPVTVQDLFNEGLAEHKAIYCSAPYQIDTRIIDRESCTLCGECEKVCPCHAINLVQKSETFQIEPVVAVIVASGVELFDPASVDLYGFGYFPNVVTSTAFERIISSSGPYQGEIVRPSDRKRVRRIGWIQCVGSRNIMIGADYCSRVCCMFAIKQAVLATKKIGDEAKIAIFYMDMRTFGRDFQIYRDRAEDQYKVRFVRCRIHSIEPAESLGDLKVSYVDSGNLIEEVFDMMVLSIGQLTDQKAYDFKDQEGVFVLDSAKRFMDISESMIAAQACSGHVVKMLHRLKTGLPSLNGMSNLERNLEISEQKPYILVILVLCDMDLKGRIDSESIGKRIKKLPGDIDFILTHAVPNTIVIDEIKESLSNSRANRLVLGLFNPNLYFSFLKELERQTGLSSSFVEIFDLGFLVKNEDNMDALTDRVFAEIESKIDALRLRQKIDTTAQPVIKKALVVGGGSAGLSAASFLSECAGVVLIEKSDRLGGNLPYINDTQLRDIIEKLIVEAEENPRITIYYNAEVIGSSGVTGSFETRVRDRSGKEEDIVHGATIIATGGKESETGTYSYGQDDRIVTIFELEKLVEDSVFAEKQIKNVVMIQCVDSREEPCNYCSRICCLKSLKAAVRIKDVFPQAMVYIFYRDIMTYGYSERFYTEARRKGILFIPFEKDKKPQVVVESERVVVNGFDPILGESVRFEPDLLSLATGVIPNQVDDIARIFGLETTCNGFIKEADSKWLPADTGREGIFLCGLVKASVRADEAIMEGKAAAQRAFRILTKDSFKRSVVTAQVRHSLCSFCGSCMDVCRFHARHCDSELERIIVDFAACQGCGACAAVCPNSATIITGFEEQGIMSAVEMLL